MLTKRQKEALTFITSFAQEKGFAPSLKEIAKHLQLSSVSTAHYHVDKLNKAGHLKKEYHRARSLNVAEPEITVRSKQKIETSRSVAVYGMANAGPATIFAEENISCYVKIPNSLRVKKDNLFAVQVRGDSMNQANINGILDIKAPKLAIMCFQSLTIMLI